MMFAAEKNSNSSGSTTLIAEGTTLTGDIDFTGNLEIEGTVIGNIASGDEGSRIRVLNSGSVIGDISGRNHCYQWQCPRRSACRPAD